MNLTFESLCRCEPQLSVLEKQCKRVRKNTPKEWERERIWYHDLKHQMSKIVGFMREKPCNENCILFSSEAYNVAYSHFIDILEF